MAIRTSHYRSVADLNELILRRLDRIPHDVDLVVGIPRSGLLAATLISLYLNRPLTDLDGLEEGRLIGKGKREIPGYEMLSFDALRHILIVDDCVSRGTELGKAKARVQALELDAATTFLTIFSFPENPCLADITLEVVPRPMCFQWSFMHTPELSHYCLDIDGILCRDATQEEDDDGPNYLRFLREASPLLVPTAEVGWLVTSRLEKYRAETEAWLERYGVRYRELIMLDMPSKEARERSGRHVSYKADTYRRTGAALFIESSPGLAEHIAEASGQPVMCPTTNRVIGNPALESYMVWLARSRRQLRRLARAPNKLLSLAMRRGTQAKLAPPVQE